MSLATVQDLQPTIEIEGKAPPMPFNIDKPDLTLDDIMPPRFFSNESLEEWLAFNGDGAAARVLTISGISMELLYDPVKLKPIDGEWKPCLHFAETASLLVINRTRSQMMTAITGTKLVRDWGASRQVAIGLGNFNKHYQIGISTVGEPEPEPQTTTKAKAKKTAKADRENANADLFG